MLCNKRLKEQLKSQDFDHQVNEVLTRTTLILSIGLCSIFRQLVCHAFFVRITGRVEKPEVEAAYLRGAYLEKRKGLMADWAEFCEEYKMA